MLLFLPNVSKPFISTPAHCSHSWPKALNLIFFLLLRDNFIFYEHGQYPLDPLVPLEACPSSKCFLHLCPVSDCLWQLNQTAHTSRNWTGKGPKGTVDIYGKEHLISSLLIIAQTSEKMLANPKCQAKLLKHGPCYKVVIRIAITKS